jgi:hypothetical protein
VIDLSRTYRRLGRTWTHEELAVRYLAANRHAEQLLSESADAAPDRPIALLATAIPSAAALSVAIHLLHALPAGVQDKLPRELLATAEANTADALHRCHRALELDGHALQLHRRRMATRHLRRGGAAARVLAAGPGSTVRHPADAGAVRWLSSSIACLDQDSRETPAALTDTLARLLVVCVFAHAARTRSE